MAAVIDDLRVPPEPVKKEGVKRAIPEVRRASSSAGVAELNAAAIEVNRRVLAGLATIVAFNRDAAAQNAAWLAQPPTAKEATAAHDEARRCRLKALIEEHAVNCRLRLGDNRRLAR